MKGGYFVSPAWLPEVDLGNGVMYRPGGSVANIETAKAAYVAGRIELDEFEARVGELLGVGVRPRSPC